MTNLDLIDYLLELSKTLARDLQALPGVSAQLIILNSSGFDPTAIINLKGPAYHDHQIEVELALFALKDDEHELHLDLEALDLQKKDFVFNIHCDLVNLKELTGYLDKALSLYRDVLSSESDDA